MFALQSTAQVVSLWSTVARDGKVGLAGFMYFIRSSLLRVFITSIVLDIVSDIFL